MKKFIIALFILISVFTPIQAEEEPIPATEPGTETWCELVETNHGFFWYENGIRQGVYGDPLNITDTIYGIERGREIYDPENDVWRWLDACYDGAVAIDKEVWFPYVYQDEEPGSTEGKWVRYDIDGCMLKGVFCLGKKVTFEDDHMGITDTIAYYHDVTGAMLKGMITFHDEYEIDQETEEPIEKFYNIAFNHISGTHEIDYEFLCELKENLTLSEWEIYNPYINEYVTMESYVDDRMKYYESLTEDAENVLH